jgi:hypothetical protein
VKRSEADSHGHYGEHEPPQENPKLGNLRGRLSDVEQADSKEQPKDRKDNVGSIAQESENKGHKEKPNEIAQPLDPLRPFGRRLLAALYQGAPRLPVFHQKPQHEPKQMA